MPEVEEASADKRKCGRKRKSAALEADAPEPTAKVARMSEASEPAMAPVAQMIALVAQMIARASGAPSCADEKCRLRKMRLPHEGWRIFSVDQFEAGSCGLRDRTILAPFRT